MKMSEYPNKKKILMMRMEVCVGVGLGGELCLFASLNFTVMKATLQSFLEQWGDPFISTLVT